MDESVVIVARDLERHGQTLSVTERACLDGGLRTQPALQDALRRAGDVERLGFVDQDAILAATATCAPAAIGRALHRTFVTVSDSAPGRTRLTDWDYACIGSTRSSDFLTMLHHPRRVPTSEGMETYARFLYLCAPTYVTDGPLAQSLSVRPDVAACAADRVAGLSQNLIPEVSHIMFGQGTSRRSKALRTVVNDCRQSTKRIRSLTRSSR